MISETITVRRYEVGDVLDISKVVSNLCQKRRLMREAKRGVVWRVKHLKTGECTYLLILDIGNQVHLTPDDQGNEKYIGTMDLSLLTGTASPKEVGK